MNEKIQLAICIFILYKIIAMEIGLRIEERSHEYSYEDENDKCEKCVCNKCIHQYSGCSRCSVCDDGWTSLQSDEMDCFEKNDLVSKIKNIYKKD